MNSASQPSRPPRRAGSLRRTIWLGGGAAALGVALVAGLAVAGIERGAWLLRRAEHSYVQLGLAHRLEARIAAYMLAETQRRFDGAAPPAEVEAARVAETLAAYRARAEAEVAMIFDPEARAEEAEELERAADLARVFGELRAMYGRARGGEAADDAARSATLSNLATALRATIAEAVEDEEEEADEAQAAMAALRQRARLWAAAAAGLALAVAAFLAAGLGRAILRPLGVLAEGVRDFGEGALGRRLTAPLPAEFAPVTERFNAMAARIEAQQVALAGANAGLQDEVAARTRELTEANARLEAVDAARRRFIANVSHELRTPLTVLLGEAEVALRGPGEAGELREACERITANGDYLRRRLDDLMRLARSEEGELALARSEVDLAAVAREAAGFVTAYARSRGVGIDTRGVGRSCPVMGDGETLRQAALALIDNAVKHAPQDSLVEVGVAEAGGMARLCVADAGRGFNPANKHLLFERYGRESAGGDGQGLGLAIARWIAERHGGGIDAELRPTGGAVFTITLPARFA